MFKVLDIILEISSIMDYAGCLVYCASLGWWGIPLALIVIALICYSLYGISKMIDDF